MDKTRTYHEVRNYFDPLNDTSYMCLAPRGQTEFTLEMAHDAKREAEHAGVSTRLHIFKVTVTLTEEAV